MQYNTQQKRMPLPEYGRSIQNMVDHALTIQDPAERQRCANTIINIMGNMFPHLRDVPDFKHKLWDHLAIMADFKLDIKYPYEIIREENLGTKPDSIPYPSTKMRYRHYGRTLEVLIKKACEFPEGDEKRNLVALICNHMKKDYMAWNKDTVDDRKIAEDLDELSGGKLRMDDDIIRLMAERLAARGMFPVFCVCAGKDMGVRRLMEFLGNVVPFVSEMPKVTNTEGKEVAPDANGPTSLYFFKTSVEPHIGEVSYFKVMSGKVHEGDDLVNADRGSKERMAQLYVVAGSNRIKVEELLAGDIGATVKLKDVKTGNTLDGKDCDYKFNFIKYPNSKYSRAIKPVNEADVEKMMSILNRMREEDPTWVVEQSKELKQTIVHGQGEFHLRTLKWRLENNEKLQVKFEEPKIPYRETITKAARADYRHKKQSGGAGQFGEVHLIVEPYKEGMPVPDTYKFNGQEFKINVKGTEEVPLEWGGKLVFVNSIVGGSIDARFLPAILKGVMARMEQGPLTGSYARDVRVIVYDGKMHPVDSNEISFMLAGRNAFSEAFKNAGPKILEPIYDVEVFVPSDKMGDVMGDLQGRRAMIMGMSSEKGFEKLIAKVPLKEMASYSTALSSLTGGRASFIMKFASYELVPSDVQDKLIKDFEAKQVEE